MKEIRKDFKDLVWPSFSDAMVINLSVFVFLFVLVSIANLLAMKELKEKNKQIEELEKSRLSFYSELSKIDPKLIEMKEGKPSIRESFLFASGDDKLSKEGILTLNSLRPKLSTKFNDLKKRLEKTNKVKVWLRISGHTDNKPIHTEIYKDNWDLSAKRAANVLRELAKKDKNKLSSMETLEKSMFISGFGEFQALNENKTDAQRKENRRVSIEIDYQEIESKK